VTPLDLWDAIAARLDGDARFAFYEGAVPDSPPSAYVVGYPNPGIAYGDRLKHAHNRVQFDAYLVCVGRSTSQCVNTAQIVRGLLADWRPDDSGSASALVEQGDGAPLIKDETSNQADIRWSHTLHYRMHTSRS
jgi:hypothetical protein